MKNQENDYSDRFAQCQQRIKLLSQRCPQGVQNWSYQKSIGFKKTMKKMEGIIKLKVSSKHVDYLKIENALSNLELYYK